MEYKNDFSQMLIQKLVSHINTLLKAGEGKELARIAEELDHIASEIDSRLEYAIEEDKEGRKIQ